MFLASLPILIVLGDFSFIKRLASQCIASLLILGNYGAYKFAGDYFNPGIANPFIHTWSLSIEEQFYIFFPLLLIIFSFIPIFRRHGRAKTRIVLTTVGVASLYLFLNSQLLIPLYAKFFAVPQTFIFYSPITRLWQFALGGLLAIQSDKLKIGSQKYKYPRLFLVLGLIAILLFPKNLNLTAATIAISFLAVVAISARSMDFFPESINRLLQWIGDRSYSIYLIHLPLIYLLLESPYVSNLPDPLRIALILIVIVLILVGGDWMFRNIEERFRISLNSGDEKPKSHKVRKVAAVFQFAPLLLSAAVLFSVAQGFFGLVAQSSVSHEGDTFQKYCVRESFVRQFPCRFKGPATGKSILLLGDSHASQYSIDIWKIATSKGYEVYFGGDFGGPIDTSKVISLAREIKPQKIIFSKYWRSEGAGLGVTVSETILELKKYSQTMGIIGQNPIFRISETRQNRSTLLSISQSKVVDLGPYEVSISDLDSGSLLGRQAIEQFAMMNKIIFINPSEVLCSDKMCRRWENGDWLYIDNNHLSSKGAGKVRPLISKLFNS